MTHHEILISMFKNQDYVPISQMRTFCDYRKRISELRLEKGYNIVPIIFMNQLGQKIHAYKLVVDKKESV